ncbi:MAG TPA: bacillithiol biosynthesis BshC, partial [Bacteroidia bacterium]|nr:bacillithiol biosynthesis BshC [Bacteroidia bacterium]
MDFKVSHIPFAQTNAVNALVTDYYTGNKNLETYYAFEPNLNGINEAIEKRTNTAPNRKLLHHALQKQYSNLPTHNEVKSNLSSLLNSQTFTVTTGHQLNLFTGPLYFIYKIASAIKLAQILNQQYSDKHFVPVYWMASEDHDFDEINHTYVFDKKINWTETNKGPTGSL